MTDTLSRMRQLIGTTAEWAANDIVIGDGEIALENTGTEVKAKVGDGAQTFSALKYVFESGFDAAAGDARYVQISDVVATGGTAARADRVIRANSFGRINDEFIRSTSSGGAGFGSTVVITAPSGKLDPNILPDLSSSYLTQAAGDARYAQLTNFATAGGVAAAGKYPTLNASGVIPSSMLALVASDIPDLSATYVPQTDVATAPAANKIVKALSSGKIDTAWLNTTLTGNTAAQAGLIPVLDSNGHLSETLLNTIAAAENPVAGGAGKFVLTSGTGRIDNSLISLPGVLKLKGTINPTVTGSAPTAKADGDTYVVNTSGAIHSSWGTGISGDTVQVGDLIIWLAAINDWDHVASTGNLAYLPLSGGTITGSLGVNGTTSLNGNTALGNANTDTVTVTARVASSIVPSSTKTRDLGESAHMWRDVFTEQIQLDPGTVANPSMTFVGDSDTGLYRVAAGQLGFATDGKNALTINAAQVAAFAADVTIKGRNVLTAIDGKAPLVHTHTIANVTGLQAALDGKAALAHNHSIADVTGLQTALDAKAAFAHTHAIADVTGLQNALNGKASSTHNHTIANVTGLQTALNGKESTITVLPVPKGGTGAATHTANYLLKGNAAAALKASLVYDDGTSVGIGTPNPAALLQVGPTAGNVQVKNGTITIQNGATGANALRAGLEVGTRKLPICPTINADAVGGLVEISANTALPSGMSGGDVIQVINTAATDVKLTGPCFLAGKGTQQNEAIIPPKGIATIIWDASGKCFIYAGGGAGELNFMTTTGGYKRFTSGLLIQWGQQTVSGNSIVNANFPIAFPTRCTGLGNGLAIATNQSDDSSVAVGSNAQIKYINGTSSTILMHYIAIGY